MLHFIRDRAQGWIAWFIVGLITIPFALWGVNSYISGPSEVIVAEVNGEEISQTELQQAVQQYRDQMRNMLGERFDPAMFEGELVKREVLDGLIEQQLLKMASHSIGQTISDSEISNVIFNTSAFHRDGAFDNEYYAMVLARAGYTPIRYERQLKNDLLQQQLTDVIQNSGIVTSHDVSSLLKVEKQQREIAYGVVPVMNFADEVIIDDEAVRTYYDLNQANYMAPETVKVNFIRLSVSALAEEIEVTDEVLKQFYSENLQKFVGPQQRRASHILIESTNEDALAKITSIKERLNNGEDFAALAKELSQDTGSAQQGGDLGYFQRDVMDPAFEEATFSLSEVSDISEPVLTEYGYHLIKLTGIQEGEGKAFDEVKDDVTAMYKQQQAESVFYDKAEQLANLTYEFPDNLDVAAEELGLEVQTTDTFTRQGGQAELTREAKFITAAFSNEVLNDELNSAVIELSETDLVVLHKKEYSPASVLSFEAVSPAIREQLKFEKASTLAKEMGQKMLAEIAAGEDETTLFTNWQAEKMYRRDSDEVSVQILQHAFAMPKPVSAAEYSGFTANNGNYIVIKLSDVKEGDPQEMAAADIDVLKGQLSRVYADEELQAFIAALKDKADIEIKSQAYN